VKGQRTNEFDSGKESLKVILCGIDKSIKCIERRSRLDLWWHKRSLDSSKLSKD